MALPGGGPYRDSTPAEQMIESLRALVDTLEKQVSFRDQQLRQLSDELALKDRQYQESALALKSLRLLFAETGRAELLRLTEELAQTRTELARWAPAWTMAGSSALSYSQSASFPMLQRNGFPMYTSSNYLGWQGAGGGGGSLRGIEIRVPPTTEPADEEDD